MKPCPNCNEELQSDIQRCPYCGTFINRGAAAATGQPGPERGESRPSYQVGSSATKKCPYCAEVIQAEAVVCKHCGKRLEGGARKTWTAVAGLCLGVVLVGLFLFWMSDAMSLRTRGLVADFGTNLIIWGAIGLMVGLVGRGFSK